MKKEKAKKQKIVDPPKISLAKKRKKKPANVHI
jgi:hypothetical protein